MLRDLLCVLLNARFKPADLQNFGSGAAGLNYCRTHQPELVIVDLGLPDMDGRQVIRALHAASPHSRIVVLTGQISSTLAGQLLALGVSGYVDKASPLEHLDTAIQRVLEGGIYFSAGLGAAPARVRASTVDINSPSPELLTEREREIVRLVAAGLISKEIADKLSLSPRTVEKARAQILAKLELRDLPELVRWCIRHGLA